MSRFFKYGLNGFEFEKVVNGLFNSPNGKHNARLRLPSAIFADGVKVSAAFDDIDQYVVDRLANYNAAVGCSPWVSENSPIVSAVRQKDFYSLILSSEKMKARLYTDTIIPSQVLHPHGFDFGKFVMIAAEARINAIEYINMYVNEKQKSYQRLHSKFLVLGNYNGRSFDPTEVITGSFNFTVNARNSLENVVSILDPNIADSYASVWYQYLLIAAYQRDRRLVSQSEWIESMLQSERDDAVSEMIDDPNSAYNYEITEREREGED